MGVERAHYAVTVSCDGVIDGEGCGVTEKATGDDFVDVVWHLRRSGWLVSARMGPVPPAPSDGLPTFCPACAARRKATT